MPMVAYVTALFIYVAFALVVWGVAIVLAISPHTRKLAKQIAAGMAGSFPGVFIFQLLSASLAVLILLLIAGVLRFCGGGFNFVGVYIVWFLFFAILFPASMFLIGFCVGWRIAWKWASGLSIRECFERDEVMGPLLRVLRRRLPFLDKVL